MSLDTPSTTTRSSASSPKGSAPKIAMPQTLTDALRTRLTDLVAGGQDAPTVTMKAPFNGLPIAELPQCTPADVLAAAERARVAQKNWAGRSVKERAEVFLTLHDLVLENREVLMDLIQVENGKARRDAFLEVGDIANTCRYYARTAEKHLAPQNRTGLIRGVTSVQEIRHPKGIVTVISPWNYPLSLAAGDTIPALIAGNAVIQKPDNQTALVALFALDLAHQAGVPEGLWQMVLGRGSTIGDTLFDVADYIMFTGSTESGRRVAQEAGKRLVDCSLELGGKNAMIILDDANLDRAAEGSVRGCFSSSGQLCISIERLYVQEGIYDEFMEKFLDQVRDIKIGGSFDYEFAMGTLTSPAQLKAVQAHVDDAVNAGAEILAGGRHRPEIGPLFFEPTVLTNVTEAARCFGEETFGPVVSIYKFSGDTEAIERANDTEYGLNASVWGSPARARRVGAQLKAGTVNVNEAFAAAWGSMDAPMGGMGTSGLGRRHGAAGIQKYTESQTLAHQRFFNLAPPFAAMSDAGFADMMTKALKIMKKLGMS